MTRMSLIPVNSSGVATRVTTDAEGKFSALLKVGRYFAVIGWDSSSVPAYPTIFSVVSGSTNTYVFYESVP